MLLNIIKYYKKVTDLALGNIKNEKRFNFKSKLNNDVMLKQSEDHLINMYKRAGGGILSGEVKKHIEDYKKAMKNMHELAVKDYKETLELLKRAKNNDEKQMILNRLANRGFKGFISKDNKTWNIETYSNMYFTHLHNEMIRLGMLDYIKDDKIQISSHNTKCELCRPYEGKIMLKSELDEARSNGLFHPHCKHIILEVNDD
jgi:hypothetical protein